MPPRQCLYCEQPVYDGSGYHPECVPRPGQIRERREPTPALAPARTAATVLAEQRGSAVRVIDIEMPFGSMVVFMVKWALASIPAFLILLVFTFALGVVLALVFHVGPKIP
jgi:hypothetical protein